MSKSDTSSVKLSTDSKDKVAKVKSLRPGNAQSKNTYDAIINESLDLLIKKIERSLS